MSSSSTNNNNSGSSGGSSKKGNSISLGGSSSSGSLGASGGGGSSGGGSGAGASGSGGGASRNKCANEKRRREQENIYIEELAELISASIADLSTSMAVKPDKCAILQETVNQIRRIKAAEELAVQQGEVSSSTNILANEILCPLVLEALDGFLFVVNSDGIVEFCSENVEGFVGFKGEELVGKSIYGVVHSSDQARFSGSLLPMSIGWTPTSTSSNTTLIPLLPSSTRSLPSTSTSNSQDLTTTSPSPTTSSQKPTPPQQRSFNIRLLVKSPDASDSSYENMQITAMLMPHPTGSSELESSESCLVCIARRLPPNERPPGTPVEQFTTKLNTDGMIIGVDTSGLSAKWVGVLRKDNTISPTSQTLLQELCPPSDLPKLDSHLRETLSAGSSTSLLYKLKLSADKLVQVQTKSKFFSYTGDQLQPNQSFIMATHTIINPEEASAPVQVTEEQTFDILDTFESLVQWEDEKPVFIDQQPQQQQQQWGGFYEEEEYQGDRLRNLLTSKSENKILKGLLNQAEEEGEKQENNMLLKLLNEKEKVSSGGMGMGGGNELLNQLLSGGGGGGESSSGLKRTLENPSGGHAFAPKQMVLVSPVVAPAPGELCKRNPRLVSLLAKPSDSSPTPIPTVPPNYISGTPQEKLLNQIKLRNPTNHQIPQNYSSLPNDLILDEILDQVIDIVPDNSTEMTTYYSDDVSNILNMLESNQLMNHQNPEIAKINAIQKELMQFETGFLGQQQQQLQQQQQQDKLSGEPVVIHRTTTTTTTQIRYNQQQQAAQQNLVQQQQQQVLKRELERQRLLLQLQKQQQQQQAQHGQGQLLQLMRQSPTVSLDSLLGGGAGPPPNVTLVQQQQLGQQNLVGQQLVGQGQGLSNGQQQQQLTLPQQQLRQQQILQQQQLLIRQQRERQWNQQQLLLKQPIQMGQQQLSSGGGQLQQVLIGQQQQQRPALTLNAQQQPHPQQQQQHLLQQLNQQPQPTSTTTTTSTLLLQNPTPQQTNNPLLNAQLSSTQQLQLQQQQQQRLYHHQQQQQQRFDTQQYRLMGQQQQRVVGQVGQVGGGGNFVDVRQELRAVVGARQQNPQQQQQLISGGLSGPDLEALGIGLGIGNSGTTMGSDLLE